MRDTRHGVDLTEGPWPAAVIRDLPVGLLEVDSCGRLIRANAALVRLLAETPFEGTPLAAGEVVQGCPVTEQWPCLGEVTVAVLSGHSVDTVLATACADVRVHGVPRWIGARPYGGLLVVSEASTTGAGAGELAGLPHPLLPEPFRQPGVRRRAGAGGRRRRPVGRVDEYRYTEEYVATHDPETGLPNQVLLLQRLADALARCRIGRRVGILVVDVEQVLDGDGTTGTKNVLCFVADRLAGLAGVGDFVARVDGARLALVLCDVCPDVDGRRFLASVVRQLDGMAGGGLGMLLTDPTAGAESGRDPRQVLALALEVVERSRSAGGPVLGTEPSADTERARLAALSAYHLHDSALDDALKGVAQVALRTCVALGALVTFVDRDLQWVRAAAGAGTKAFVDGRSPRHLTLCDRTIKGRGVLVVPDTERDPVYRASRHVAWQVGMRFYAGAPLITTEGYAIGTLCVMDVRPRGLSERQRRSLAVLAAETVAVLDAHREARRAR
jgi:GGDEF domain-containing protein